ncbi:hypothetical protein [Mycobacterium avium]|uniref:hypothetical protein n=1 Tax=Mycobacterium avium TaxID=1764 RepID=UPI000BAF5402|nr:hypothetical protein [Mycobacterium avium]PBA68779.1 hypothetical protein CKJ76_26460 [Mycobacterium avium]
MSYSPQPPLPVVVDSPCWLVAAGDENQLIVYRSVELREIDPEWYPVTEHVERFGLVLQDQDVRLDPDWMAGRCERLWYVTPQARMALLAHTDGKLPWEGPIR